MGTRDPFTDFSASVISEPRATRCPELLSVDSSEHSMVLYCIPSLISMTHVWAPLTFTHNEKFHRTKQFSSQKIKSNTHPLLYSTQAQSASGFAAPSKESCQEEAAGRSSERR